MVHHINPIRCDDRLAGAPRHYQPPVMYDDHVMEWKAEQHRRRGGLEKQPRKPGAYLTPRLRERIRQLRPTTRVCHLAEMFRVSAALVQEACEGLRFRVSCHNRPVVCRTDPRLRWGSASECARALGCSSRTAVADAIERGGACRGLFLRYEDTPEAECPPMRAQAVAVVYEGVPYPSLREAALATLPPGKSLHAHEEFVGRRVGRRKDGVSRRVNWVSVTEHVNAGERRESAA